MSTCLTTVVVWPLTECDNDVYLFDHSGGAVETCLDVVEHGNTVSLHDVHQHVPSPNQITLLSENNNQFRSIYNYGQIITNIKSALEITVTAC